LVDGPRATIAEPERDSLGQALRQQQLRARGRRANARSSNDYDFRGTVMSWDGIVFIHLPDQREAVPAGRISLLEAGLQSVGSTFGYGARYLKRANAIPVDPVSLPHHPPRLRQMAIL
jgi:hypothetical protein